MSILNTVQEASDGPAIYSRLEDDPDIAALVQLYVREMPNRTQTLLKLSQARDWDGVRRLAHQIKGAASSYGFEPVSRSASKAEEAAMNRSSDEAIASAVEELVAMCARMRAGR